MIGSTCGPTGLMHTERRAGLGCLIGCKLIEPNLCSQVASSGVGALTKYAPVWWRTRLTLTPHDAPAVHLLWQGMRLTAHRMGDLRLL